MIDDYAYRLNEVIKVKKRGGTWREFTNHPHPLDSISLGGTIEISHDTRGHPTSLTAERKEDSIDFGSLMVLTRKYFNKFPYVGGAPSAELLANEEFAMLKYFYYPYYVHPDGFRTSDGVTTTVGTSTVSEYSRPTSSDPWTLNATNTYDIECTFSLVSMQGGGFVSPGNNTDCEIAFTINNANSRVAGIINITTTRETTDDSWADESDAITAELQDKIDTLNAALAGSASFSSTAAISFAS